MSEFVEGLKIETKSGQYGEYMKASIDLDKLKTNPLNEGRYLNFMIFKSKAGNWYAKLPKKQDEQGAAIVTFTPPKDEELPF